MKKVFLLIAIPIVIYSCGMEDNPSPTTALFFDCYDAASFGELRPSKYEGMPLSCFTPILEEQFEILGNWYNRNDADFKFSVNNGYYDLQTIANSNFYINIGTLSNLGGDYQIESLITIDSGEPESSSGISWGGYNGIQGGLFYLGFTNNGSFNIGKLTDNAAQDDVVEFTTHPTVSTTSKLTIRLWEGGVYCFINEQLVHQFSNIIPFGNEIGIKVGYKSRIKIDWLTVHRIEL